MLEMNQMEVGAVSGGMTPIISVITPEDAAGDLKVIGEFAAGFISGFVQAF